MLLKSYISLHNFLAQKCQNKIFEKSKGFECSFLRIEEQVISNSSSWLEKTPSPLIFAYEQFFYDFLKKELIFRIFQYLKNNQLHNKSHTRIIVCVLFYVNMLDQSPYSSISPNFNIYSFKIDVHFRFECEIWKVI